MDIQTDVREMCKQLDEQVMEVSEHGGSSWWEVGVALQEALLGLIDDDAEEESAQVEVGTQSSEEHLRQTTVTDATPTTTAEGTSHPTVTTATLLW